MNGMLENATCHAEECASLERWKQECAPGDLTRLGTPTQQMMKHNRNCMKWEGTKETKPDKLDCMSSEGVMQQ